MNPSVSLTPLLSANLPRTVTLKEQVSRVPGRPL